MAKPLKSTRLVIRKVIILVEKSAAVHTSRTLPNRTDGKRFKIIKEESSSAGVRRVKAVLA